ncbi:FAD:protein FMN transferase [Leisingera sp. MMG026]|uniref:FAD:protein FMN transferase n=1 Tax=Leisingera sp. MMG026 TaxID=2909982 RepID=UPI001F1641D0|nr:FAD:protein FMN transferase [Leisingera sp. MMG026]MCF6432753.1 FAD:protein FMN transferase [Leisingera sp. MMG026]
MSAKLTRRRFLTISAAALGVTTPAARAAPVTWHGFALGAEARLTIHAPQPQADRAIAAAQSQLRQAEQLFSLYDPTSSLSRLNRSGFLKTPPLPFLRLIRLCTRMHTATKGVFDPTVQPLWHARSRGGRVDEAARLVGWHKVSVTEKAIRLAPGQALTFNGIAQGYATDMVRTALGRLGLERILINAGEFAALGGPFRVGLADPERGVFAARSLTDRAIASSSPGALELKGSAHILHPALDRQPQWATVSTEAASAALADAASTAFCLMQESEITAALARLPGDFSATLLTLDGRVKTMG